MKGLFPFLSRVPGKSVNSLDRQTLDFEPLAETW